MKKYMRYPIIPITFFYVNGIFFSNQFYQFIPFKLVGILTGIFFLFFLLTFILKNQFKLSVFINKVSTLILCLLFFGIGSISYIISTLKHDVKTETYYVGDLTINEVLKPNTYQNRYFAKLETTSQESINVLVYQDSNDSKLNVGDRVESYFFLQKIPNKKNPYQFNYAKYLQNKQIYTQTHLTSNFKKLAPATGITYSLYRFREKLIQSFQFHHFSNEVQGVINALLFGERTNLSPQVLSDYRNAGVMHILAISGLHIGILYALLHAVLKRFLRSKKAQFYIIIAFLGCFAIITGLTGSVVRAVVMFGILGSANLFNRQISTLHVLVTSMLFILVFKPLFLFDVGFQLSYLAVFSIVYIYPIIRPFCYSKYWLLRYFYELIGISLIAQIGILPLSIYYFGQVSFLFIVGNLIVIPILTFVLIGAILVLVLNFVSEFISFYFGKILALVIEFCNTAIHFIATQDQFIISNLKLNFFACVLFLLLIFLIASTIKKYTFSKLIFIAILVISLQISFFHEAYLLNNKSDLVLFYDYNSLTVAKSQNHKAMFITSDSLAVNKSFITDFKRENEIRNAQIWKMKNYFEVNDLRFLVVDSIGVSEVDVSIDVLILKDNPKFNLERYFQNHKPKLVVFHPKNYKSNITFWKQTCLERKIPFHDMQEKGFIDLNIL